MCVCVCVYCPTSVQCWNLIKSDYRILVNLYWHESEKCSKVPVLFCPSQNRAWDGLELKQIFRDKKPVTKFMNSFDPAHMLVSYLFQVEFNISSYLCPCFKGRVSVAGTA